MTNYDYVELPKPKVSGFDLSYSNKLTMDLGDLVPVYKQEVLPGDEFKVNSQFMVRMAPLSNPIFTKLNAQIHYFFVPNRLLWDKTQTSGWENFITGGKDGTLAPIPPYLPLSQIIKHGYADDADGKGAQTLADYMGIPYVPDTGEEHYYDKYSINAFPFLAYNKIYDDWFRDPNVTNSIMDTHGDHWLNGGDLSNDGSLTWYTSTKELLKLKKRSWSKDYFTSALPWAQRGPEVTIPVGQKFSALEGEADDAVIVIDSEYGLNPNALGTLRDLRNASALQLWLEKNAVGGARYIEQLLAHFGVYSDDARLQRAEYLGSVKSPIVISEVQSNAETEEAPLGKLGGKGISYGNDFAFNEKFKEHGWIIGIMSILPDASYCQGLHRSLTHRMEKLDYAFPEFCEIGLQEIVNSEIYVDDQDISISNEVFGYGDRYGEYKSNYNEVHGLFKNPDETLSQYNMTRFFGQTPELSKQFLEVNEADITSPFVDTLENRGNFWVDLWNDVKAVRPLTKNSVPLF